MVIDTLPDLLRQFDEASRDLLKSRSLQQRLDRKHALPTYLLGRLLLELRADHHIVKSAHRLSARYESVYFDTKDRRLYDDHRRGRRPRYKVRLRHHLDRRRTFLEVKRKDTTDRTTKARLELPFGQSELDAEGRRFIDEHSPVTAMCLMQALTVSFHRVTLVGIAAEERVTLDWELEFRSHHGMKRIPDVVIAEIKQPRYSAVHGAARAFRLLNVREESVSKYCLGTAWLAPVRSNAFKPAIRRLEALSRCGTC
jgi:hypothetical protein